MARSAPFPSNEMQRIAALRALDVLDTEPEAIFDSLASTAAALCGAPVALVSLVDTDRQWFKSCIGLPEETRETPRDIAFCAHVVAAGDLLEVPDATEDERFAANPLVTGPANIRFYAGAPIRLSNGHTLGTLCVIDRVPRKLDEHQLMALRHLAGVAARGLEARAAARDALALARQAAKELARGREFLQVTLDSIEDSVITTDVMGGVQWMNPAAERSIGWSTEEAAGHKLSNVFVVFDEATRTFAPSPVDLCLGHASPVQAAAQLMLVARDGSESGIECSAAPMRESDGSLLGAVLTFRDVSEQRRLYSELNHRARHDVLTGLPNRTAFEDAVAALLANNPDGAEHALMYIDLDQFKLVNDACGHAAGDQLLRQIGGIVRSCVRSNDLLARLGGDEFALLLQHCAVEDAQEIAQKICDEFDAFRFVYEGRRFRVGSSIGLVPLSVNWPSVTAVVQAADASCYAAKEEGRNRVHTWHDSDKGLETRQGEMQLVSRLELALDEDRFELHGQRIQPISQDNGGLHFEVLVRMREADGSLTFPGAFLPIAERFHLATRLDRWVVQKSFDWMSQAAHCHVEIDLMAVNLSGQSLSDGAFHRDLIEMIRAASFDVSRLCFEITETAAITHLSEARTFIEEIRLLGVKVALDDFGAGASSFGYLKSLPVDFLKIDGHFITHMLHDELDNAAVRCFREVAKVMKIKTIAEFVENDAVRGELQKIGIDMVQGYLIHKPEPLAALLSNVSQAGQLLMSAQVAHPMIHSRRLTEIPVDGANPNCLDLRDPAELMLWADDLGITVERLREVVGKVGPMRAAVRSYAMAATRTSRRAVPA